MPSLREPSRERHPAATRPHGVNRKTQPEPDRDHRPLQDARAPGSRRSAIGSFRTQVNNRRTCSEVSPGRRLRPLGWRSARLDQLKASWHQASQPLRSPPQPGTPPHDFARSAALPAAGWAAEAFGRQPRPYLGPAAAKGSLPKADSKGCPDEWAAHVGPEQCVAAERQGPRQMRTSTHRADSWLLACGNCSGRSCTPPSQLGCRLPHLRSFARWPHVRRPRTPACLRGGSADGRRGRGRWRDRCATTLSTLPRPDASTRVPTPGQHTTTDRRRTGDRSSTHPRIRLVPAAACSTDTSSRAPSGDWRPCRGGGRAAWHPR